MLHVHWTTVLFITMGACVLLLIIWDSMRRHRYNRGGFYPDMTEASTLTFSGEAQPEGTARMTDIAKQKTKTPRYSGSSIPLTPPVELPPLGSVIVLGLFAQGRPFHGYELLQGLLSTGLRFGDMQIFHRHETVAGKGAVLFSMASAVEPGTFDIQKMGSFSTTGLTFFLQLDKVDNLLEGFDTMVDAAHQLADTLGGVVCTQSRERLSDEIITGYRYQLAQAAQPA